MNARAHAGAGRDSLAVLGVLAASLVSARNPAVPELAVAAICLFLRPRLGGLLGGLFFGLAMLPLLAMLPAAWFGSLPWRAAALGLEAPATLTPQPWAFLSAWTSYLSGLAFLWWVCGRMNTGRALLQQPGAGRHFRGRRESRAQDSHAPWVADGGVEVRQICTLIFAVAISSVMIFSRWESGAWRGPMAGLFAAIFDTRNQAASFAAIALCGSAVHAVGVRETKWKAMWALAAAICAAALLALGSRGGVLAALAGCLAGGGILLAAHRKGLRVGLAIGASVLVGAFIVLSLPSVPLINRFAADGTSGLGYRLAVQADAWRMLLAHPVSGVGLGSFDGVFPFFRALSTSGFRAAHPESDWLWLACEAGFFAGLFAVWIGVILAGRWWNVAIAGLPVPAAAGLGCLAAMAVHGILDVPAHSGPVWFLAAALAGVGLIGEGLPARPMLVPLLSALLLGGLALAQSKWTPVVRPLGFSADRSIEQLPGRESVERWLRFRPLDVAVFEVAVHQAIRSGDRARSRELLGRLFALEPFSPVPASRAMGLLVARGDNDLALLCAQAILCRASPARRAEQLREILKQFAENRGLVQALLGIEPTTAAWQAVRIEFLQVPVSRAEFELLLALAARRDDPGLAEYPALRVFSAAMASGHSDLVEKASAFPAIPSLRRAAIRARSENAASCGDPASACLIVMRNLSPSLDQIDASSSAGADAYGLTMKALVEWRGGNFAQARKLLSAAVPQEGAPPLAWYLLGCAEFQDGASGRAWDAFQKFLSAGDQLGGATSKPGGNP